jgi:hypothetical protein
MKMDYKNTTRGQFEALIHIHYKELSRRLYRTAEGINLTLYYVKSTTQPYPLHVGTWQKTKAWLELKESSKLTGEPQ